jgi:hypothetical protein
MFRFLKKFGNYSTIEIENMYPFEMELYFYMLMKEIKEEQKKQENSME